MKCPNKDCEGEIMFIESLEGNIFSKKYKKINYFCPLCDWNNVKKIQISNSEFNLEIERSKNIRMTKLEYNAKI